MDKGDNGRIYKGNHGIVMAPQDTGVFTDDFHTGEWRDTRLTEVPVLLLCRDDNAEK